MIISPHRCSWSLYSHAANRWCWPLHSAYGEQTARCAFAPSCPWRAKCKECIITRLEIWTVFSEVFKISTENWLEDHTIVRLIQLCQVAFFFFSNRLLFFIVQYVIRSFVYVWALHCLLLLVQGMNNWKMRSGSAFFMQKRSGSVVMIWVPNRWYTQDIDSYGYLFVLELPT